jgi:pimeloyl-ACP methyl ester carboxylesterase
MTSTSTTVGYDARHEAPHYVWDIGETPDFTTEGERVRHDVVDATGTSLPLQSLLLRRPESRTLVVYLHGSLDRAKYETPRFERLGSLQAIPHNLLFLADPTLLRAPALRIGWFIGTTNDNVTDRYAEHIRAAVAQLSIDRLVLAGASSGGYAAIALAPRLPNALALAFSPQVNVGRYGAAWAKAFTTAAFPDYQSYSELEAAQGDRVDLATLYRRTTGGRVWYVQNDGDDSHISAQMVPFRDELRGDTRVTFVVEHHCSGHNPPTVGRTKAWIEFACNNFDADPQPFRLNP